MISAFAFYVVETSPTSTIVARDMNEYNTLQKLGNTITVINGTNKPDARCISVETADGKCIVFGFRGSISPQNWIDNLDIKLVRAVNTGIEQDSHLRIHKGFAEHFYSLKDDIFNLLKNFKGDTVYLTGHSLGAASACLATFFIKTAFKNLRVCTMTLGAPRVGNYKFVEFFEHLCDKNISIIIDKDPVPDLPPDALDYQRISKSVVCFTGGTLINEYPPDKCGMFGIFKKNNKYHDINLYIDNIKKHSVLYLLDI